MQFKRRLSPKANVDLIPMIDVVFQLVVFFMVSSTFILTPGISIDLPGADSSEPVVMSRIVVTVAGDDELYINRDRYNWEEFRAAAERLDLAAQESGTEGITRSVIVEGDRNVAYDTMVRVLDVLRRNGFRGVNLRTREDLGAP